MLTRGKAPGYGGVKKVANSHFLHSLQKATIMKLENTDKTANLTLEIDRRKGRNCKLFILEKLLELWIKTAEISDPFAWTLIPSLPAPLMRIVVLSTEVPN